MNRLKFLKTAGMVAAAGTGIKAASEQFGSLVAKEQTDIKTPSNVKSVIFVNMAGGMSHVDTFDPKPGNGKFGRIRASNGAQVTNIMPRFAKQLKHLNMVRSLHSREGSHERGSYLIHTGHRPSAAFQDIPSFGAIIAYAHRSRKKNNGDYFPAHITLGSKGRQIGKGGFLGINYDSFHIGNTDRPLNNLQPLHTFRNESDYLRQSLVNMINSDFEKRVSSNEFEKWKNMQSSAISFMNSKKLSVFDLNLESKKNKARYGSDRIAKSFLMAKRLAENETPFIELTLGGWDTHNNNFDKVKENWSKIDRPMAALVEELAGSGLLSQTMFIVNSEFGRTVEVRADRDGRDHYPRAWTAIVGGGKLPRGVVYGATDKKAAKPVKNPTEVSSFVATIYKAAGVNPHKSLYTQLGRPFTIIDDAKIIPGFGS